MKIRGRFVGLALSFLFALKGLAQPMEDLKRKAANGDATAQINLGLAYASGDGVPKNSAEAAMWFRRAALQGDAVAQYDLGRMYLHGNGVPKDPKEAVRWYRKAADQGEATAQYSLGAAYATGGRSAQGFSRGH